MKTGLTPAEFASALRGGFAWLEINSALLDRLNVFPVPDGDTGSNLVSTMASGIETIPEQNDPPSMAALAGPFDAELTRCSRGNSGFILARFFHGFFETAGPAELLSANLWKDGLANGSFHVNGALFAPAEGTMISILAAVNDALAGYEGDDVLQALRITVEAGTAALFRTPAQLPILARAGVIDSGALGLLCIFRGILADVLGEAPRSEREQDYRFEPDPDAGNGEEEKITYRYCTEAVVRRNDREDGRLGEWLRTMGDSIALVDDTGLLKIHIHTNNPEAVFERLEFLGTLEHRKVDDMEEQSRLVSAGAGGSGATAILAFVPGEGFERIYEDFGVTSCFVYSDTLPSPEEITAALEGMAESQVIILPNNSNILPSVMAVRELTDRELSILPTKNVIQGITACYGFSMEEDAATNVASMSGFLDDAEALFLYRSARETVFGSRRLKDGDWFISRGDDILGAGTAPGEALAEAVGRLDTDDVSDVTVYHGEGIDPRELDGIVAMLRNMLPDAAVEHHYGGQKRAALIISLE